MVITKLSSLAGSLFVAGALALAWSTAPAAAAQEVARAQTTGANEAAEEAAGEALTVAPVFKDYRGVTLGVSADEARRALGGSDAVEDKRDVFLISEGEMAQLFFDRGGKLQAVAVTYLPKSDAPTAAAVLGVDVPAGADGRVYKLIRYPEAGYWVSYNRTAGDPPIVTVTMRKMIQAR